MASFNRVILLGNLTHDIELQRTTAGVSVTDIGLAINDRTKRNGAWQETTVFVGCTLWDRTAEIASQYLRKGSPVLIEGRLRLDQWEKDETRHSQLKVVCDRMQMLERGRPNDRQQAEQDAELL